MHKIVYKALSLRKPKDGKDYDHIYDLTEKAAIDL